MIRYHVKPIKHLISAFILALCSAGAAPAQMTPDEARQALLPYVQAPDTTLGTNAVVYTDGCPHWNSNHTAYMFYGDSKGGFGGQYWIDTVDGSKWIEYYDTSTWDMLPDDEPTMLSASQLTQIASDFASQHFSGYPLCTITNENDGDPVDPQGTPFFVEFQGHAASGALLPVACMVCVEDDVGHVSEYGEQNIPVTISTAPALTQDQAIAAGQQWLLNNVSSDPADGQLESQDELSEPVVALMVAVDNAGNEELDYRIDYHGAALYVDAQTGAVVKEDDWVGMPANLLPKSLNLSAADRAKAHRDVERQASKRERFWQMGIGSKVDDTAVDRLPIHTQGQTYLWAGYLKALGVTTTKRHGKFNLIRGARAITLTIKKRATGAKGCAWDRTKLLYVPVPAVQELCPEVTLNEKMDQVVLNAPGYDPAVPSGAVVTVKQKGVK